MELKPERTEGLPVLVENFARSSVDDN